MNKHTRCVFISDVHGRLDKLKKALADARFDAEKDTLVSLGDLFDRGDQSWEVLKYVMNCPNRILLWGNHDFRLRDLMLGKDMAQSFDYSNGVLQTMHSFCPELKGMSSIDMIMYLLQTDDRYKTKYELIWKYFNECVWAVEWDDLIATHGWLPHVVEGCSPNKTSVHLFQDWRSANRNAWYTASWAHTEKCINSKAFPDKQLIVGHWHAWRLHQNINKIPFHLAPFTSYISEKVIGIDGCSNADEGVVNTYIAELDAPIAIYNPRR